MIALWLRRRVLPLSMQRWTILTGGFTSGNRVSHECDKEHVKCIVHRITNDFRIADSARAAIVVSECRLSLKEGAPFLPEAQQSVVVRRRGGCRCSKRVSQARHVKRMYLNQSCRLSHALSTS